MNALQETFDVALQVLDFALGWLLRLPRDVTLVAVTLLTVLLLVLIRRGVTDQDRLRRTAADLARLKSLRREARRRGDRREADRLAAVALDVKRIRLRADLVVLIVAILPLGLLASWASLRLDYLPAQANQRLVATAYFSLSSVGRLTHVTPRPDMTLESPPLQLVQLDSEHGRGVASWTFRPRRGNDEFRLVLHHAGESAIHRVRVGSRYYAPAELEHAENERLLATHVSLRRYKFLGVDPGLADYGAAPWLIAYVLLSIALTPLARRLLRTA